MASGAGVSRVGTWAAAPLDNFAGLVPILNGWTIDFSNDPMFLFLIMLGACIVA